MNQRKRNRSWQIRCEESTKLLKIWEWNEHTIGIYSVHTRQDGDNVRHMHLIDLHLLKHLHHTHSHSCTNTPTSSTHTPSTHTRSPMMSINTNSFIECWTIKRKSCSHILHALHGTRETWRLLLSDVILSQYNGALPSHHILVFINDKRISNSTNTIDQNQRKQNMPGESGCKIEQMNNQTHANGNSG